MPATAPITVWHWLGFIVVVLIFLALDLGVFHRRSQTVTTRNALFWTGVWFVVAMGFAGALAAWRGRDESLEFVTAYFVEYSLSMDNIAAIALIFSYFGLPNSRQHRVLFWGILGVMVTRGVMIGAGAALIQTFHWILYLMGAFLVLTGGRWLFQKSAAVHMENNRALRWARRVLPLSTDYDGNKFFTFVEGRRLLTPLAVVLLMVETTDLVFAFDSIPAVFSVTQKAFIVFTSNIFAILGLRSLYFALARAIGRFRFLKSGLAIVLIFVGAKMLVARWLFVSTGLSLAIVGMIMAGSIGLSLAAVRPDENK